MEKKKKGTFFWISTNLLMIFLLTRNIFPTGAQENSEQKRLWFTHFLSLPLVNEEFKIQVSELQKQILETLDETEREKLVLNPPDIMHITLSVLNLKDAEKKRKALEIFAQQQEQAKKFLENTKVKINLGGLDFFGYVDPKTLPKVETPLKEKPTEEAKVKDASEPRKRTTGVIFLDVFEDEHLHKLRDLANIWLKQYVEQGVIPKEHLEEMRVHHNKEKDLYHAQKYHVTLFRFMEGTDLTKVIQRFQGLKFGEAQGKSLDLSVMGTYDEETKFYKSEKRHHFTP